jgi:hypothetical protein
MNHYNGTGDVICIRETRSRFYAENTWSFTRIGKVLDMSPSELLAALGDGDPTAVFSLNP